MHNFQGVYFHFYIFGSCFNKIKILYNNSAVIYAVQCLGFSTLAVV